MKKKYLNRLISISLSAAMLAGSFYTVPAADFSAEESVTGDSSVALQTEGSGEQTTEDTQDEITVDEGTDDFSDSSSDGNTEGELTVEGEEAAEDTEGELSIEEDSGFQDSNTVEEDTPPTGEALKSGKCGDNITWSIQDDHVLYITGTGAMDNGGSGILKSPWYAYKGNPLYDYTKAVISNGVTSIGDYAFWGLGLEDVSIPTSVTRIGNYALAGVKFSSLTLSAHVKEIGEGAFSGSSIVSLNLGNTNITEIPAEMVKECSDLISITLPEGITEINRSAFEECTSLTKLKIPEGVTYFGRNAFRNCTKLASINIPGSVNDIAYEGLDEKLQGVFTGCKSLKTAGPGSQYNINLGWGEGDALPRYAFCRADGLESVVLPDGMTGVEHKDTMNGAFESCVNLTSVSLPDSFTYWNSDIFVNCESLTDVNVPYGVEKMYRSFEGCKALKKITIPSTVKTLDYTFRGCESLTDITIPEGVTAIDYTFQNCSLLKNVTIPNTVTSMQCTFTNCSDLTKLTIPASVKELSYQGYVYNEESGTFYGTPMDSVGPVGSNAALQYEWTDKIPDAAFAGMNVQEVIFPDTITEIGEGAFQYCKKLKRIALPETLKKIPIYLFGDCESLTTVRLPEKIDEIGYGAFEDCSSLKNIYFRGDAPSSIGDCFTNDELTAWYPADKKTWTRKKRKSFGGKKITWKPYKAGKPVDDSKTRDVTLNGGGKATVRFFLTDKDGNVIPEQSFWYVRQSSAQNGQAYVYNKKELMTDFDGGYAFETPYYVDTENTSDEVTYEVHWVDSVDKTTGVEHEKVETFTVNVKVQPMVYSETWSSGLGTEAKAGVDEWNWFGYGHDAESKITLKHKADGSEDLVLGLTLSYAAKAKLEKDGKWGRDDLSNVRVGKASGSAKATDYYSYETKISNFQINNRNHQKLLAAYLELMMVFKLDITGAFGKVDALIANIFGGSIINDAMQNFEISESGIKVNISGGSTILTMKNAGGAGLIDDMKFGALNGSTTYSSSQKRDENNVETFSAGVKSSNQYALISGGALSVIGSGGLLGFHNVNSTSVSVNDNDDVTLSESKFSSGIVPEIGYDEVISSNSLTIPNATELVKSDQALYALDRGQNYPITSGELAKAAEAIKDSDVRYTYSVKDNLTNSYGFQPSIKVFKNKANAIAAQTDSDISPVLDLGFSINYTHGWSTETSNGVVKEHTVLQDVDSSSSIKRARNDADNHDIAEIMVFAAKGVSAQLADLFDLVAKGIGNLIKLGSGAVSSSVVAGKNWTVNLLSRKKASATDIAGSYEVYTVSSEEDAAAVGDGNEDTVKTGNTVGDAFAVSVTDEDANQEVEDFSAADLNITLGYTEAELQEAGATLDDASDLAIYRLDKESGTYVYAGSEVDTDAQQVSAPVDTAGEYILIYDGAAPSVTDINVTGSTSANPVITAKIMDVSGVSSVTMSLDGECLVTADDFEDFYDKISGEFSYKLDKALEKGEHTVSFTAEDKKGQATDSVDYTFTVNDPPKFTEIFVPKYTLNDENVTLYAKVDSETAKDLVVSAKVTYGNNGTVVCNMNETEDGTWEGSFAPEDTEKTYKVQLTVSNGNGDETQSEVYECKFTDGEENCYYTIGDTEYGFNIIKGQITYISTTEKDIEIPAEIEGKTVKSLDISVYNDSVNSLTIPECVKEIEVSCDDSLIIKGYTGSQAEFFAKIRNLKFVSLGEAVNKEYSGKISGAAWIYKDGILTLSGEGKIAYGYGYEEDDYPWFALKDEIRKVVIREGITSVGQYAFSSSYTNLKEVEIAKSVTDIGYDNFQTCDIVYGYYNTEAQGFASTYGKTFRLLEVPTGTFGNNNEFTWKYEDNTLTISGTGNLPDFTKGNENRPWSDTVSAVYIDKVIIENGITGIGAYTFEKYYGLEEISLPDSLKSIGDYAFIGCTNLNSCIVPDSVTSIGEKSLGFRYSESTGNPTKNTSFILRGDSETAKKYAEDNKVKYMGTNEKLKISDCRIYVYDAEYQNGKEVIPYYEIYSSSYASLNENVDYTVRFENNKNVGTAKAVFTGIGLYEGTEEREFDIYAPDNGDDNNNNGNNGNNGNNNNNGNNSGVKHEHVYAGWKLTKAPTVFAAGIQTRTCRICGAKDSRYTDKADPTGRINMSSIPLKVKQSTAVVKVTGLAAGDYVKSYNTSNTKIATVNAKGKITAKKKGNTNLIVKLASGKTLKAKIKVQKTAVKTSRVAVNTKKVTLKPKKSFQLKTTVTPLTSLQKVTYTSSNKKVVTVSKTGKLVTKKAGKAKITVKSGSKKVTVTVTVKKK